MALCLTVLENINVSYFFLFNITYFFNLKFDLIYCSFINLPISNKHLLKRIHLDYYL